ncbi:amidase domain-containing protein [Marasmitruncus massiliensis]|uniref:amidase domain-containing protein n=1 Tax=Marasmitruncus massiliensis TaxID=1944642 RepID=UPI000C7C6868|nr:amidase domain-containing protein [Marasmitruncus massiliensis]
MTIVPYRRDSAVQYAEHWAFDRNPRFFSFDGMGGDCTNFISQCIYAGSGIMNYQKDTGWYFNNSRDRSAAWSGVPFLYRFLTQNRSVGPFASVVNADNIQLGDVIQLGNEDDRWYHSLLVTGTDPIAISTHTYDAHLRPLSSYTFAQARYLHIEGVRRW